MRLISTAAIACLGLAGLGGCGRSDEAFRAAYRTSAIQACTTGARSAPEAGTSGIDIPRLCTCGVDNYLAHASTADLRSQNETSTPPGAREAIAECVAEQLRQSGRMPAAETAPPPPPAPGGVTGGK